MLRGSFSWPPYIQPRPGHEALPSAESLHLPVALVDLFYLRRDAHARPVLVAIVSCLGGALLLATPATMLTLPPDLQDQIRALQVNQRGTFRLITAQDLWLVSLDAIEQQAQMHGYNDAVTIYGRIHAQVVAQAGDLTTTVLSNDSRITVGRLDFLYGWRLGFAATFQNPLRAGETITHCCIPVAPCSDVQRGTGLAIVYPVLDPARHTDLDNTPLVLRIVHDLLAQLQHDLLEQQSPHTNLMKLLPVPSRQHVEAELTADGYQIRGDTAVRQTASPSTPASTSLLSRLRHWTQQWSAAEFQLPPQARINDYQMLIDAVLAAIATPADLAMFNALLQRIGTSSPSSAPALPTPRPAQQTTSPPTSVRSAPRSRARPAPQSWASDFTTPAQAAPTAEPWWQDFEPTHQGASAIITQADSTPTAPEAAPNTAQSSWSSDFTRPVQPAERPAEQDWSSDFD